MNAKNILLFKKNKNIFYTLKTKIEERVNYCKKSKEYINAFIMGNKKEIDINYSEKYQQLGISHLFAISGMHITLISTIILIIFSKFKSKNLIEIVFLIFYMFLTSFSPSVLRASLMLIIYNLFEIIDLKVDSKYILIFLFSTFLLSNPYYIYDIGFQFSFLISYSIISLKKEIDEKKNYLCKTFFISLISFLISLPIVINNFYQVNLLSVLFNIIYVPFISFVVFPLGLVTYFFPKLDLFFYTLIMALEYITKIFDSIPSIIFVSKIPLIFIFIYYIFILYYVKNIKIVNSVVVIILIIIFYNYNKVVKPQITFIDVGQGDSILIRFYEKNILIDTGGKTSFEKEEKWKKRNSNYSICNNTLLPFFKSSGLKKIDYLVLTHGDYDHAGEAKELIKKFKVENVIFNNDNFNDLELELIKVLKEKNIKYYKEIKELNIYNNKLYFLSTGIYDNENDNSNVIYTELNNYKFLFMGDASTLTEKEILNEYKLPSINVLKVGHHGSKTSSSKEFINTINPRYSIISVGKNNRYNHPNKEALENLNESKIYRTDEDGSIMFKLRNDKLKIETCIP